MGRLISEKEIVNKNAEWFNQRSTSEWSRFLDGMTPTFTTYYSMNMYVSKLDLGLENAEKLRNAESPIKYNMIKNFCIFGIETMTHSLDREEYGVQSNLEGNGIILPQTVKPLPDDYFSIDYLGFQYLFRIKTVNTDRIQGKPIYSIEFSLSKVLGKMQDIEMQIENTYVCYLRNIGTERPAVILQDESITLQYLEQVYESLYQLLGKSYYSDYYNIFTHNVKDRYTIYNRFLFHFLIENKVLKPNRSFLNDYYIRDQVKKDTRFYRQYNQTIYRALEVLDKSIIENDTDKILMYPLKQYRYDVFFGLNYDVYDYIFMKNHMTNIDIEQEGIKEYVLSDVWDKDFIYNINHNILYKHKDKSLENIIIRYLNGTLNSNNIVNALDDLNNFQWYNCTNQYFLLPIILFILRKMQEGMEKTIAVKSERGILNI